MQNIKIVVFSICLFLVFSAARGQQPGIHFDTNYDKNFQVYGGAHNSCDRAREYYKQANERTAQYEQALEEYKKGLFCNQCWHTKSELDKLYATSGGFWAHIKDGEASGRRDAKATPEMYAKLYKEYRQDFDPLRKQYEAAIKECTTNSVKLTQATQNLLGHFNQGQTTYTTNYNKANTAIAQIKNAETRMRLLTTLRQYSAEFAQIKEDVHKNNIAHNTAALSQNIQSLDELNNKIADLAGDVKTQASNTATPTNTASNNSKPVKQPAKARGPVSASNRTATQAIAQQQYKEAQYKEDQQALRQQQNATAEDAVSALNAADERKDAARKQAAQAAADRYKEKISSDNSFIPQSNIIDDDVAANNDAGTIDKTKIFVYAVADGKGFFRKTSNNMWGEFNAITKEKVFMFSVVEEAAAYVLLYDVSRKIYLKLTDDTCLWGYSAGATDAKIYNGSWIDENKLTDFLNTNK